MHKYFISYETRFHDGATLLQNTEIERVDYIESKSDIRTIEKGLIGVMKLANKDDGNVFQCVVLNYKLF